MSKPEYTRLLTGYDQYTDDGRALSNEVRGALTSIIAKYIDLGYSSYDIELIVLTESGLAATEARLLRTVQERKKEKLDKA